MNWTKGGVKAAGWPGVLTGVLVATLTAFGAQPLSAQEVPETANGATRYAVGATGVTCDKAPCPVRGIWIAEIPQGSLAEIRKALHYADHDGSVDLPNLRGAAEHRHAVQEAWDSDGCVIVEGDFGPDETSGIPRLRIDRVVGPC